MKTWSPFDDASFGTFCIQIGQRLELLGVVENFMEIDISTLSKQNPSNRRNFSDLHRHTIHMAQIYDQFGCKKYQMKRF